MSPDLRVLPDAGWAGVVVAEWSARLAGNPGLRMCLPTGKTPSPVYRGIADAGDFSRSSIFLLDEFGLPPDDPARCDVTLRRDLIDRLDTGPAMFDSLNPQASDIGAECDRYEMAIAAGGLGLTLLGLGNNGHLGLNEPGCDPGCPTRKVTLAAETIDGLSGYGARATTDWGITVGLGRLLQSDEIWLLVTGPGKAGILRRTLEDPISPEIPATYLRTAPNVIIWADESAAAELATV
ncbi:galactosamine-6-phosphate isomerase [soil metagenome]